MKEATNYIPCLRPSGFTSTRCSASTRKRAGRSPLSRAHVLPCRSAVQEAAALLDGPSLVEPRDKF